MQSTHNESDGAAVSGSPARKILLRVLRVTLVVAPLVWIYAGIDAGAFMEALAGVNVPLLLGIAALNFFNIVLQGVKWWTLLRRFVPHLKLSRAVSVNLESTFYAIALPSAAAQDIVKSVMLSKSHSPSVVWAASWLSRLLGLVMLLVISVAGIMYLDSGVLPEGTRAAVVTAVAAVAVLCAASFSKRATHPLRAAAAKVVPPKYMAKIEKLREGIYAFKYERAVLIQALILSAAVQLLAIACTSLTVFAVSGKFYFVECLVFVPIVEIMAVSLPLTPGGVGIREALMALLFTRLGFSGEEIATYVTLSLLLSMVRVFGATPILYRMITGRKRDAASE